MTADSLEKTLIELDDRRYAAMRSGDMGALADLLSDKVMVVHSTGGTDDKQKFLDKMSGGNLTYRKIERTGTQVRVLGPDAAIVSGRVKMECVLNEQVIHLDNTILALWVREDGTWRLASAQSTPTPK